jgi:L-methionine (R)-S-oxide reductase
MIKTQLLPVDPTSRMTQMLEILHGYLDKKLPLVSNLANMSAILHEYLTRINWVGFYLMENGILILGPFQGLPACTSIGMGKGVCGTAALAQSTIIVADVTKFLGHIACDDRSKSEIVVPILKNGTLIGVLDVDSPVLSRCGESERLALEKAVDLLIDIL